MTSDRSNLLRLARHFLDKGNRGLKEIPPGVFVSFLPAVERLEPLTASPFRGRPRVVRAVASGATLGRSGICLCSRWRRRRGVVSSRRRRWFVLNETAQTREQKRHRGQSSSAAAPSA